MVILRLSKGLGLCMNGSTARGKLVITRTELPYQHSGNAGSAV